MLGDLMRERRQRGLLAVAVMVWCAAGALAWHGFQTRTGGTELKRVARPLVLPHPYTVYLKDDIHTADGRIMAGGQYIFSVRSDGTYAFRAESLSTSQRMQASQRLINPPSGDRIEIDDLRELKSTTRNPGGAYPDALRDPRSDCQRTYRGTVLDRAPTRLNDDMIQGYATIVVKTGGTTRWFAKTLGCALVQMRRDDGKRGFTLQTATRIEDGEPTTRIFEIPKTYREVFPSELLRLKAGSASAKSRDQYYTSQPSPLREQ